MSATAYTPAIVPTPTALRTTIAYIAVYVIWGSTRAGKAYCDEQISPRVHGRTPRSSARV